MKTLFIAAALLVSGSAMAQSYYDYPTTSYQLPPVRTGYQNGLERNRAEIDRQANFTRNLINRQIIQDDIEYEHRRMHRRERLMDRD